MALIKISDRNQHRLQASFYVNSLKRAVEELVFNSLDADSTSIAIRVCVENKYVQVLDNGIGISKDNFRLIGDKYVTSKFIDIINLKSISNKYGYKGIALASIIEISENVKITSKSKTADETWMKTFAKGSAEIFQLTTSRPSKGTTVEISGFLYNLTIQQKSIDLLNEINFIKLALEQLSLVHCNVSLSLRDDSKNEIVFKIHKNRNIYQTLWSLFEISSNDLKDLQVEKNQYKVKAYIGKNNPISKTYHWIFLNGRFISKTFIHRKIKDVITKKTFTKKTNKHRVNFTDEYNFNNKIPSYFIFISCPNFDFDIICNQKQTSVEFKNREEVNKLFEKLISLYHGDIKLMPINTRNEVKQHNDDTRKRVKEIMEKILNKNAKVNAIQLQNGIKGKNIKRKVKKNKDINNQKTLIEKQSKLNNSSKPKKSKFIEMNKILNCNELSKSIEPIKKILQNNKHKVNYCVNNKCLPNKKKSTKTIKINHTSKASIEPFLKKFEDQTETIKKRCQKLSHEVQSLLNSKFFNNNKMYETHEELDLDFDINHSEYMTEKKSVQKYTPETNAVEQLSTKHLTIYDLIKTNEFKEQSPRNVIKDTQETFIKENIESYENTLCTFNSHEINRKLVASESHKHVPKFKPFLITNTETDQRNMNDISLNSLKSEIFREYNNHERLNLHYESNVIRQDTNIYYGSGNYYTERNHSNCKMSLDNNNFEFGNTFTINILNSLCSSNYGVNETYSIKMTKNLSYNNIKIPPSYNDSIEIKNDISIFTPESRCSSEIEPIKYCEAILNSTEMRDVEKEFDTAFYDHEINLSKKDNNCTLFNTEADNIGGNEIVMFTDKDQNNELMLNDLQRDISNVQINKTDKVHNKLPSIKLLYSQVDNADDFKLKGRHRFVPKGMSQIFDVKFRKNTDYNNDEEYYEDAIYKHFADDVRDKFEIFEPNVNNVKDIVSKEINKVNDRINKDNADLTFNTATLKQAHVLGQVDQKFIAAKINSISVDGKSCEFLTLFDQHAVDERVRLERNLSDYFDGIKWKSFAIETIGIKLSHDDYFYLYNHKDKFAQFGLEWTFADNHVLIHAVPEAIIGKIPRKTEIIFVAVKKLIFEQIGTIKSTSGNVSLYPKCIMELIFSEACRYATKFGDPLSKDACVNMISALAKCKTPFQCAHGRPVMAIIMEIPNNNLTYDINLNSLRQFKKIMP